MIDKQGKNQDDLQKLNRALVMRLIHKLGVCSRAELAKRSGLTKASITGITQQLIDAGVVIFADLNERKPRGRARRDIMNRSKNDGRADFVPSARRMRY